MKLMDMTASQARVLTSEFAGPITASGVLESEIGTHIYENRNSFSDVLKDVSQREDAVLVLNFASDDADAPLTEFLCETQKEKLKAAISALVEASGAKEVFLVCTDKTALELPDAKIVKCDRSVVLREESALFHMILRGELRSCPLDREYLSEGLEGKPTLVVDAQTLVRIYAMAMPDYESTKLMVIRTPGMMQIAEFKEGTGLDKVVEECGEKAQKSVLTGGLTGVFTSPEALGEKKVGLDPEWDFVGIYGAKDCMASLTASLAKRAREESCQKCVLCREGSWHFENIFGQVTAGKAKKEDLAMVEDIGPLMHVGSFCSFGQKMAQLFVSSVGANREELEAHFVKKKCPAGVCAAFSKPVIDPSKCTGCTDCLDACDEDAITGKKKFIHMIDPDMCENCGKCAEVCEEGAIVPQDGTIRVPKKLVRVGKF